MQTNFKNFTSIKRNGMGIASIFMTIFLALSTLLNFGCSSPEEKREEATKLYTKARNSYLLFNARGVGEAIDMYERAIEINNNYAPAYAGLGEAYAFMGLWSL
jgi:tetratricopeptide (TPR) repeat protein